jgi:hypothetical protein
MVLKERALTRWAPVLAGFLLTLPSVPAGFMLDDWSQRAGARGQLPNLTPGDLFSFGDGNPIHLAAWIERGPFPWFTLPELKLRFFRPLSSWLIALDTHLFADAAWAAHLHSSAWYVALVALVFALYRTIVPSLAWSAAMLFAVDDAHVIPTMWLANRNAVLSVFFVWCGLWAHLRWRERGLRFGWLLSVASVAVGLCAGETAVAALGFVVAYETLGRTDSISTRLRALAPTGLLVTGYVFLYKCMGCGAFGTGTYVDPSTQPLLFLAVAPVRALAVVGSQTFGLPDLWLAIPESRIWLVVLGVASIPLWLVAWRRWAPHALAERRTLTWLVAGALLSLLPTLATFPAVRLLTAASFGLAPLVAALLKTAWNDQGVRRVLGTLWLVGCFVLQPVAAWAFTPGVFARASAAATKAITDLLLTTDDRVVIVSSSDFIPVIYGIPILLEHHHPVPKTFQAWSMAPLAVEVKRLNEHTLEVATIDGAFGDSVFEENFRGPTFPLRVGQVVALDEQELTVLETKDGKAVRIRVELALNASRYVFLRWNGAQLERVTLPRPGESIRFERAPTLIERELTARAGRIGASH